MTAPQVSQSPREIEVAIDPVVHATATGQDGLLDETTLLSTLKSWMSGRS